MDCNFFVEVFDNGRWKVMAFNYSRSKRKDFFRGKAFRVVEDDYLFVSYQYNVDFDNLEDFLFRNFRPGDPGSRCVEILVKNYMMMKWLLGDVSYHIFGLIKEWKLSTVFDEGYIGGKTFRDYKMFKKISGIGCGYYNKRDCIKPRGGLGMYQGRLDIMVDILSLVVSILKLSTINIPQHIFIPKISKNIMN